MFLLTLLTTIDRYYVKRFRIRVQKHRAIEALEARALPPPADSLANMVNSLQNRVKSITLCVNLNANTGKIVLVTLCIQIEWLFIMLSGVKL